MQHSFSVAAVYAESRLQIHSTVYAAVELQCTLHGTAGTPAEYACS